MNGLQGQTSGDRLGETTTLLWPETEPMEGSILARWEENQGARE
jgi:hypothetical protein